MSGTTAGEHLTMDMVAAQPPREAVVPTGRNSFAIADGAAEPMGEKRRSIISLEAGNASSTDDEFYPAPTEEERTTLRKVADSIPAASYTLCVVELAERASYYGVQMMALRAIQRALEPGGVLFLSQVNLFISFVIDQTCFANYLEYKLPEGGDGSGAVPKSDPNGTAGALGKGLQFASAMVLLFTFLAYVTPIFGAWLADTKLGRYKTIIIGVIICGVSHIIMICGALPSVLRAGNGMAPFMVSFFLLAFGAGVFKPNVAPTVIDQYTHQKEYVRTLKSGERVLVDPEVTIQRIMLYFYSMINIGAFFAIATTYAEKYVGYWLAFLLPGIVYFLLPILLGFMYKRTIKKPPMGSELTDFFKIVGMAIKQNKGKLWGKNFWHGAKPSVLAEKGVQVAWSDKAVEDVHRTFIACQIFLYFPIYNLNDGGVGAVSSNQAAAMVTNGAPNDLLSNFNPLTIIVAIPILSHVIYPALRKYKIKFGRITRITFGFMLAAISGMIGAIIQYRVYKTSPCGYQASTCDDVSPLSVWWQIPNVSLGALSECFCNVTAYELAYARAPPHLKSVVMALFLFTTALSSALGEIISPAIKDPHLVWVWAGPAIALFVQTIIFHWKYKHVDNDEFMTYEEEEQRAMLSTPTYDRKPEAHTGTEEVPVAPGVSTADHTSPAEAKEVKE